MKKVLIVCGNGLGSSFMVEIAAKKILKELGIEAEVSHTDLATSKTEKADLYIGSHELMVNLADGKRNVVGMRNLLNKDELRQALVDHLRGE
ncbi:phosphotransferase system eiib component type 2/3 [Lucifera butyrica]|uniref:Phosphotransferase system eiib component type 2/3 n=1 Tax=Lucifera butyrica TaxID=1351585 RepID=A0A498QZS5_9FIRM|nr:PTS sugar transporter subunit IIB [Lucifera butyrica]VBB05726.1 phosphotransferase system eiib component type 2/3 [Lucifera butyrica]